MGQITSGHDADNDPIGTVVRVHGDRCICIVVGISAIPLGRIGFLPCTYTNMASQRLAYAVDRTKWHVAIQ